MSLHCSLRRFSYLSLLFFGTLHSDGYIFPVHLCLSRLFFSQLCVRLPQTTILPFCISFSWGWFWSLPLLKCYKSPHIVLQALCLSDLIPWIYLSLSPFDHKGFWFRSYLNGLVVFPTFLNLSLNLAIRISWPEPQSAPSLVYTDCRELLHSLATKNIINLISVLTIWWCSCVESYMAVFTKQTCNVSRLVVSDSLLSHGL